MAGILLALAALTVAAPAADPLAQPRECLLSRISPADKKALADHVIAGTEERSAPAMSKPMEARVQKLVAACVKKYQWSDARAEAAMGWTTAMAVDPHARSVAARDGIDFAGVERVVAAMSPADRATFLSDDKSGKPEVVQKALEMAAKEGVQIMVHQPERAKSFGVILGLVLVREQFADRFTGR